MQFYKEERAPYYECRYLMSKTPFWLTLCCFSLFSHAVQRRGHAVSSSVGRYSKQWMGEGLKGVCLGLFQCILAFFWKVWTKVWQFRVRITCKLTTIRTLYLPYASPGRTHCILAPNHLCVIYSSISFTAELSYRYGAYGLSWSSDGQRVSSFSLGSF